MTETQHVIALNPYRKGNKGLDAMLFRGQADENGILFVCFPITAIAAVLSRSLMTVKRSLNELETAGLIMRVRQGVGEPNRIYVLIPGKEDVRPAGLMSSFCLPPPDRYLPTFVSLSSSTEILR